MRPTRRLVLAVWVLIGCRREVTVGDAATPTAPVEVPSAEAGVVDDRKDDRDAVEAWNAAHHHHDAAALATVYAPRVAFYGTSLIATDAIAKKAAALAATPDFDQRIAEPLDIEAVDANTTWVRFTKTTITKKTMSSYPMLLVLDASHRIVEESDDVTVAPDWCLQIVKNPDPPEIVTHGIWRFERFPLQSDELVATTKRVVVPFRISVISAIALAKGSKHIRALGAPGDVDPESVWCAKRCAHELVTCGYHFPISIPATNHDEWVFVDAVTKELAWERYDASGAATIEREQL